MILLISLEKNINRTNNDGDFLYIIIAQTQSAVRGSEAGVDLELWWSGKALGHKKDLRGSWKGEQAMLK